MDYSNIVFTKESGVATIKFNRPQVLNALDRAMGKDVSTIRQLVKQRDRTFIRS